MKLPSKAPVFFKSVFLVQNDNRPIFGTMGIHGLLVEKLFNTGFFFIRLIITGVLLHCFLFFQKYQIFFTTMRI